MPIHKTKDGKWQYGEAGKKYESKEKAIKQGLAILYSQAKEEGKKKPDKEDLERHLAVKDDDKKQQKTASAFVGMGLRKMAASGKPDIGGWRWYINYNVVEPLLPRKNGDDRRNYNDRVGKQLEDFLQENGPAILQRIRDPKAPVVADYVTPLDQIKDDRLLNKSEELKYDNIKPLEAKAIATGKDLLAEFKANDSFLEALKVRGLGYLAGAMAGALVGRLVAGKKNKWWGYGLGTALGLGLNYLRRKSYYGGNVNY